MADIVFHAGLLVLIVAASLGPVVRFEATAVLPQEMPVTLDNEKLVNIRSIPFGGEIPFASLRLNKVESRFEEEQFPVAHTAEITIGVMTEDGFSSARETLTVNGAVRKGGLQFMLYSGLYAPLLLLKDKDGGILYEQFTKISNNIGAESEVNIPGTGLTIYARYFPDFYREGVIFGTRSREPNNPAFGIKITHEKDPFTNIWSGVLKKGEKAHFSGMTLELADLKSVVTIQIARDPTYYGIFAGWVLVVAALFTKYLLTLRRRGKREYNAERGLE